MPKFDPKEPPKYGQVWQYRSPEILRPIPLMLVCKRDEYAWLALNLDIPDSAAITLPWSGLYDDPERRLPKWERLA